MQPEDYALLGYSSGGHLAGLFGSEEYGYRNYGVPKPGALLLGYPAQRPALTRTLKEHHIPYKEVIYRRATHGVGTGINTDAEGWINDAVAFWEEQSA